MCSTYVVVAAGICHVRRALWAAADTPVHGAKGWGACGLRTEVDAENSKSSENRR